MLPTLSDASTFLADFSDNDRIYGYVSCDGRYDGMAALVRTDLGLGSRVRAALIGIPEQRPSVVESILPDGWELIGDDYDGSLVCPCGNEIEMDGVCSSGCVSPLRTAGLI